jgi:phage portal protein BeeE
MRWEQTVAAQPKRANDPKVPLIEDSTLKADSRAGRTLEQEDHPLMTLLDGVNERMTGIELKYVTMAHLELTGNCYWLLDGVTNDTSPPRAIYPLDPGRVRVQLDKTSYPYKLDYYTFTIDNKVFRFEPYQILHIKYPDPNDPFVGIGIPQTIPSWIDSDNYAMEYNRKFFINGASVWLYVPFTNRPRPVNGQIAKLARNHPRL